MDIDNLTSPEATLILPESTTASPASAGASASIHELQSLKFALDQHAIVSIADASGTIIYVNDKFCEISKYQREELLGQNHRILKSGVHDAVFFTHLWTTISGGEVWHGEVCNRNKSGELYWVETTIVPFLDEHGLPYQYISLRTEITQLKQAEEEKFRAIFEGSNDAIVLFNGHHFLDCNERALKLFGVGAKQEFILLHPSDLSPPFQPNGQDSLSAATENIMYAFQHGSNHFEWVHRRKDGADFPAEVLLSAFNYGGKQVLQATVRDISERKLSESQRKRVQDEIVFKNTILQTQQEVSLDAILVVDENLKIISFNQQFIDLWQLPPEVVSAGLDVPVLQSVVAQVENPEAFVARVQYLYEHRDDKSREEIQLKDGRIIDRYSAPVIGAGGKYYGRVWYFRDITKGKQSEEALRQEKEEQKLLISKLQEAQSQLLQSDKLASIGQLAAGVAHEINNPIGFVYSNLGTLEKYVQDIFSMIALYEQAEATVPDPQVRSSLKAAREKLDLDFLKSDLHALMDESKDGITRVKNIVQNLKDFSHVDATDEWHMANLQKGLDSTLSIVNNELKHKATVVKKYGDIPEVECLPSQINQVFMNLLVNASHAIDERGTITLRTGQEGGEVWVEVADSGKGIAPEHLQKIFDPFFTTKPVGQGTGLGLSLSYGIIQKHHGRIEVQSEVGKGTTFRIWLPVKASSSNHPGLGYL